MKDLCFHPDYVASQSRPRAPGSLLVPASIMLTVFSALLIASFASMEVITTAVGKVIPSSKVKAIRSTYSGIINDIHIQDGMKIEKGTLLFSIDDRDLVSNLDRVKAEFKDAELRFKLLSPISKLSYNDFEKWSIAEIKSWGKGIESGSEAYNKFLVSRLLSIKDALSQTDRNQTEIALERKIYLQKNDVSYPKHALEVSLLDTRIKSLKKRKEETYRAFLVELSDEVQALYLKIEDLEKQISGTRSVIDKTKIVSPVSGVVENLQVATAGVYIGEGEPLLSIVPEQDLSIAEIAIPSREIGFLHVGQSARIKVDAFPFTRYGSLPAKLTYLSRDATIDDTGTELSYRGHLEIQTPYISVKGKQQPIQIGMSLQAEIITDTRPLIDFFISPIKTTLSEALRER